VFTVYIAVFIVYIR